MSNFLTKALRSGLRSTIDKFPSLAAFVRASRDQLDRSQPALATPWGFALAGHPEMASGNFEPHETKLIRELLTEVDLFVNVGANIGYYCCHALSLGKRVIAVEPISRNVHYLLRNIRENGWAHRAKVYPVAVGADTSILEIWGGGTGASLIRGWAGIPSHYSTLVPVQRLDELLRNERDEMRVLIVVDVEGAEGLLLQGAAETLARRPPPVWVVEVTTTEHVPAGTNFNPGFLATFETFFNLGYQAYTANESQRELSIDTIRRVASGREKAETYNYVFR